MAVTVAMRLVLQGLVALTVGFPQISYHCYRANIQAARCRAGEKPGREAETERDRETAGIVCGKEACASSDRERERDSQREEH